MEILAILLLVASPGPLDQYGGHVDPMTGEYHLHAGPSYQYRTVGPDGVTIFEGNGPVEYPNIRTPERDFLFSTPYLPVIIVSGLLTGLLVYKLEEYIRRRKRRRSHRRKRWTRA